MIEDLVDKRYPLGSRKDSDRRSVYGRHVDHRLYRAELESQSDEVIRALYHSAFPDRVAK